MSRYMRFKLWLMTFWFRVGLFVAGVVERLRQKPAFRFELGDRVRVTAKADAVLALRGEIVKSGLSANSNWYQTHTTWPPDLEPHYTIRLDSYDLLGGSAVNPQRDQPLASVVTVPSPRRKGTRGFQGLKVVSQGEVVPDALISDLVDYEEADLEPEPDHESPYWSFRLRGRVFNGVFKVLAFFRAGAERFI